MKEKMKYIVLTLFLFPFMFAHAANNKGVLVDVKMHYVIKHEQKDEQQLQNKVLFAKNGKWQLLGRVQENKNHTSTMLLAKIVKKNKHEVKLKLLLVDAGAKQTYIAEPKASLKVGVPATLTVHEQDKDVTFNVLANYPV